MEELLNRLVEEVRTARKYRGLEIPVETLRDLLAQELPRHKSEKEALKAVREKLHNIIAPYLGDPDYPAAQVELEAAFTIGSEEAVRECCVKIMQAHSSTRERIPWLAEFYPKLFAITGIPESILDLACGLHSFALPWMGLPTATRYLAFDIHPPRLALINHFFRLLGKDETGICQDILVNPPQVEADAAFFFKEAHRFEQRRRGCNRAFWQALRVRWLLVSLPASSLTGRHDLLEGQRRLVKETIAGLNWKVEELQVGNEVVFIIEKRA
jgi:16S rRNA (guanine(1405)-N(7))-methyltransferase